MAERVLPDSNDVKAIIADYFDTLAPALDSNDEREKIITNCEKPFALLINAFEMLGTCGEAEKQILNAFLKDLVRYT